MWPQNGPHYISSLSRRQICRHDKLPLMTSCIVLSHYRPATYMRRHQFYCRKDVVYMHIIFAIAMQLNSYTWKYNYLYLSTSPISTHNAAGKTKSFMLLTLRVVTLMPLIAIRQQRVMREGGGRGRDSWRYLSLFAREHITVSTDLIFL